MSERRQEKRENALSAQITSLETKLKRALALLKNERVHHGNSKTYGAFGNVTLHIHRKFALHINPLLSEIDDLTRNQGINTEDRWSAYLRLRAQVQTVLDQCLEYIGGIAVRQWELDENICDLAEELLNHYIGQGSNWRSVTIVGTQRLFDEVAQRTQIIRLGFPDWDLWNLPFIAYEYGRWVAGETVVFELNQFMQTERERLIERPIETQMRELFADAFATYFLGPAYVYANICLRANATDALSDRVNQPSLVHRIGMMFGIFKQMNEDAPAENPYGAEGERLIELWEQTIQTVDSDYHAPQFKNGFKFGDPYDNWLKEFYNRIARTYRDDGFTASGIWKDAQELGAALVSDEPVDISRKSCTLPVILNAIWYARARHADRIAQFERQANQIISKQPQREHRPQQPADSRPPSSS
jgi:hypothetical protein